MMQKGKITPAGLATINEAKSNGKWNAAYSSKTAPTISDDLAEALREHESAWKNFQEFSNSTELQYVYWVNSAKKEVTRQKRINCIVKKARQKRSFPLSK